MADGAFPGLGRLLRGGESVGVLLRHFTRKGGLQTSEYGRSIAECSVSFD